MKNEINKLSIQIEGMTCANCAAGIKKHLIKNGLNNVSVNFSTGEASCDINNNQSTEEVKILIKNLGYTISKENNKERFSILEKYFYFSLLLTIPLFLHMFLNKEHILHNPLIQFFLCLPVYIVGIAYFGKSAWGSLKSRIPNMDVLIFIGSTAAFFYSIYGWIIFGKTVEIHNYLFFETTATIITLVLLGNLLEKKSIQKTTTAIKDLSAIQQVIAKKEINGKIIEINYNQIQEDDILIVNSGDKSPTDGIILSGSSDIDESMITGESRPINKKTNNQVIGGTIVNEGNIKIRATKIGEDTLLSQIIRLVKDAQNNQPTIQKIGDQVSSVFVPIVLSISTLTFFLGHYFFNIELQDAFLRSIAVLVISCPCAMGLATPTAIMVGIGIAAKNGILIKGGDTLEKLAKIKNIVFDKTGTLTTGKFIVSEFNIIKGEKDEISNIIYNVEQYSSHPIAKSLCDFFHDKYIPLEVSNINEKKGISISAEIKENKYTIGSSKIYSSKKQYDLFVMKNDVLIATLNITDSIKTNTNRVISLLHEKGYTSTLLSGDKKEKCNHLASILGIKKIFSEQLPQDKIRRIEELENLDKTIMVGDGINDAPALAKASIGMSLGNATEIAIQSADIILLNNKDLTQLPKVIQIGKHTLLTIKQNLFWAFAYNTIAIPVAIMGLLNPMWGALFMAFSDVIVIGNSIRLRYKKIF